MTLMKWNNQPSFVNLFDDILDRRVELNHKRNCGCNVMANVIENEDAFNLELSVPGNEKKDISINLENNVLTISSEKEEKNESENTNYTMREFTYTSFSRSFTLPKSVNSDKIKAGYENGILNITLPKKDEELNIDWDTQINTINVTIPVLTIADTRRGMDWVKVRWEGIGCPII